MNKQQGYLFTSESVTVGHPDKICDCIAMTIMDEILKNDPNAHTGIECAVCKEFLLIMGEVKSTYSPNYEQIARDVIKSIGYVDPSKGFSYDTVKIECRVAEQSNEILQGVEDEKFDGKLSSSQGAGDQGLVSGGAVDETDTLMPLPITLARLMTNRLTSLAENSLGEPFYPDGKSQVTVRYSKKLDRIIVDTVVISISSKEMDIKELRELVREKVIEPVLNSYGFDIKDVKRIYINPTGAFTKFGPSADSGLTGRKIVVDSYGMYFPTGGGSMNGKDPTKQDISGALMARYVAKNLVAAGITKKAEVQISYAIGVDVPCSVNIKCFGLSKYPTAVISRAVKTVFKLTPKGIEETFDLRHPVGWCYADTAREGFFGNDKFPWEQTDMKDHLKNSVEFFYQEKMKGARGK